MRIRVATINLMAPAGSFLPWGDRAQGLARVLAERQPDLIGTQESTAESLAAFKASFPNHHVLGRGRQADGSGIQCAILYHRDHFRVRNFQHFWISKNVDRPGSKLLGMGSPRVATWAVMETPSGSLTWMNVHFSHLCRRAQARIILDVLEPLPRPWLLTGDFNATPFPPWSSHRILSAQLHDLAASAGCTWNARLGRPLARLDWILGTEELQSLHCEVLREGESDHWPVLADLRLGAV